MTSETPPYRTPEGGFLAYCVVDGGTHSWLSVDEEMADDMLGFCVCEGTESAAVIDRPAVVALRDHLTDLLDAHPRSSQSGPCHPYDEPCDYGKGGPCRNHGGIVPPSDGCYSGCVDECLCPLADSGPSQTPA